jgi:hypothetical protein
MLPQSSNHERPLDCERRAQADRVCGYPMLLVHHPEERDEAHIGSSRPLCLKQYLFFVGLSLYLQHAERVSWHLFCIQSQCLHSAKHLDRDFRPLTACYFQCDHRTYPVSRMSQHHQALRLEKVMYRSFRNRRRLCLTARKFLYTAPAYFNTRSIDVSHQCVLLTCHLLSTLPYLHSPATIVQDCDHIPSSFTTDLGVTH